jgi:hypothetical protein
MAVRAVFLEKVHQVKELRYCWSEDGCVLLALDCQYPVAAKAMTFADLRQDVISLCRWQLRHQVVIGLKHALAEVVALYHAFEFATEMSESLMLVCTPPDEYFERGIMQGEASA